MRLDAVTKHNRPTLRAATFTHKNHTIDYIDDEETTIASLYGPKKRNSARVPTSPHTAQHLTVKTSFIAYERRGD